MVRGCSGKSYRPATSPHTRGDGPEYMEVKDRVALFSPHAWGWSGKVPSSSPRPNLLPTRVGMVRMLGESSTRLGPSPHTRGDGPQLNASAVKRFGFSPHSWGWSVRGQAEGVLCHLLPTRVGMVRRQCVRPSIFCTSPHTRGVWSAQEVEGLFKALLLPTRGGMAPTYGTTAAPP
jgi:hypothetical protein